MTSKGRFAGAGALIAAPIIAIAATLVRPTLSDDAANQVAAFTEHRGAMIAGIALSAIAVGLLTGGIVWLSLQLARHAPRLALAGAVLGVFGSLLIMFLTGVSAAAPAIVHVLSPAQSRPRFTAFSRARPLMASSPFSSSVTSASRCSGSPPSRRAHRGGPG